MRIATAAWLVASGLLVGAGGALALADPARGSGDGAAETDQSRDDGAPPGIQRPDKGGDADPVDDGGPDPEQGDEKADDRTPGNKGRDHSEPEPDLDADDSGDVDDTPTTAPEEPPATTEPPEPTEPVAPPEEENPEPPCKEKSDDGCGPGWPWFPWPWWPDEPPTAGDGGGRTAFEVPSGRPEPPAAMQLPAELLPDVAPVEPVSAEPGLAIPAVQLPLAPITMPVIVAPPAAAPGVGAATAPAPRLVDAQPSVVREAPPPSDELDTAADLSTSYRVGYADELRYAGLPQVIGLAAPGVAGMLVLTGAGGLVGYRQAKAGHAVRTGGTARFVN